MLALPPDPPLRLADLQIRLAAWAGEGGISKFKRTKPFAVGKGDIWPVLGRTKPFGDMQHGCENMESLTFCCILPLYRWRARTDAHMETDVAALRWQ
jgi:hypothetical protein